MLTSSPTKVQVQTDGDDGSITIAEDVEFIEPELDQHT